MLIKRTFQIEQAAGAAQDSGAKLEKWRQARRMERSKNSMILAEEDEGLGEDGGKLAPQTQTIQEWVTKDQDGSIYPGYEDKRKIDE